MFVTLSVLACFLGSALAHGVVTTPAPRQLGPAALAACGAGAFDELGSNLFGPIENSAKDADSDFDAAACHLFFCRGTQFADNVNNTRAFAAGQEVPFHIEIEARHTGIANVSVVDTASQTTIGQPLINWPVYTNTSLAPADYVANETDFTVTLPDLGAQCAEAGQCALQWWWFATSIDQTYESCVDFTQ